MVYLETTKLNSGKNLHANTITVIQIVFEKVKRQIYFLIEIPPQEKCYKNLGRPV